MTRMTLWTFMAALIGWAAPTQAGAQASDEVVSSALWAHGPKGERLGPCPLTHTDVQIEVSGFVARTRVEQRFENPHRSPIEAVYVFPLPGDAAVRDMVLRVGDRRVRADIQRRQDAQDTYDRARTAGHTASLLSQERPNLFTTSVANLPPGEDVRVTLEYVHTLRFERDLYELAFPMTVGPRYVSGVPTGAAGLGTQPDTDRVDDASRISPPIAPAERAGHDIQVAVAFDPAVPMIDLLSPSHDIRLSERSDGRLQARLAPHDTLPNRDLVLRWQVPSEQVTASVLAHRTDLDEPGFVSLMLDPKTKPAPSDITAKELIFVLDTSGSMYGQPMDLSKALMRKMLRELHPNDTFSVLRYDDATSSLSPSPLANTPGNVSRALAFVSGLEGSGGTDALAGLRAAFGYPHAAHRLRVVVFLTDGYIGNEGEVLAEVQRSIGEARLFSFGVGSSVNRFLMEEMASIGRGACRIVTPREQGAEAVNEFYQRLRSPYLTDLTVSWEGVEVDQVYPARLPDLFAGQPLQLHGRYRSPGVGHARVRGFIAGKPFEQSLPVSLPERRLDNQSISAVWARARIAALQRTLYETEDRAAEEEITQVGLSHRLLTAYTAFVAVDERMVQVQQGANLVTVAVPVALPEGVSSERLGSSASLSLARFQPGDPELRVEAPPDARAVTAVFPFGETLALSFEPRLGLWTCRFLVPRDTPEGNYAIEVLISHLDGRQERLRQPYTVDASGPQLDLSIRGDVVPGRPVPIRVTQRLNAPERRPSGTRDRVQVLADLARVRLSLSGVRVPLIQLEPGVWEGSVTAPKTKRLVFEATAIDLAGNRSHQRFRFSQAGETR